MNHKYHRNLQQEVLRKVLKILKSHPNVLGIIFTGSLAKSKNDAFSDLDVDCYLIDEKKSGATELIEEVSKIAPILSKLWIYDKNALFLFENGVRLDLNFNTRSEISNQNIHKCKIVYDPKRALENGFSKDVEAERYSHPTWNPKEFEYLDWYFWMFRQVYCWAKRGKQNDHKSFDKIKNSIDSLSQLRDGIIGMKLWIHGSWDYLKKVDKNFANRIGKSYPRFDAKEVLKCNGLLLEELKEISREYCKKRGIEYPTRKFKIMTGILEEFQKLR